MDRAVKSKSSPHSLLISSIIDPTGSSLRLRLCSSESSSAPSLRSSDPLSSSSMLTSAWTSLTGYLSSIDPTPNPVPPPNNQEMSSSIAPTPPEERCPETDDSSGFVMLGRVSPAPPIVEEEAKADDGVDEDRSKERSPETASEERSDGAQAEVDDGARANNGVEEEARADDGVDSDDDETTPLLAVPSAWEGALRGDPVIPSDAATDSEDEEVETVDAWSDDDDAECRLALLESSIRRIACVLLSTALVLAGAVVSTGVFPPPSSSPPPSAAFGYFL